MSGYAALTGWGSGLPKRTLTNADLARQISGVDEAWIVRRTGITERRVAGEDETTSTLAIAAGHSALERAGVDPLAIDLVIVATCTPDRQVPGTAPVVQAALGARGATAFDVNAACAGFLTAMAAADGMIRSGTSHRALVIGSEVLSRFIDVTDPKTCVLFGDGAAAVVLEASSEPAGLLALELGADGTGADLIQIPAGGSARPATTETVANREHSIRMNGPEVYRAAVRVMTGASERTLARAGMTVEDVDLLVLHQANQRIIDEVGARLGIPTDRIASNVARYGNTSAASVPLALAEAADEGRLHQGARVLACAVGAGLTWAAGVLQWTASARLPSERELIGATA